MKDPLQTISYFQHDIDALSTMVRLSEKHWKDDLAEYEANLRAEEPNDIFEGRRDLWANLASEYPQIQRKAFFVMLMTKFEDFMVQFANSVQQNQNLTISANDMKGSGIERIRLYLTKCTKLEFPSETQEWSSICSYQQIRNIIVHADGHIHKKSHAKVYPIIKKLDHITVEEYARDHILIGPGFMEGVVKSFYGFTETLCSSCKLPLPNKTLPPTAHRG